MLLLSLIKSLGSRKKKVHQEEIEEALPQSLAADVEPVVVRRRQGGGFLFPGIKQFFKPSLSIQELSKKK